MEPETRYAKSGGLRIAYQVTGEGPDLVMVPGLTSHLEVQCRDAGYHRFVRSLSAWPRRPVAGWNALAVYGRRRDQCAIPLSDATLRVARLDQPTAGLGTAWFEIIALERAIDPAGSEPEPGETARLR